MKKLTFLLCAAANPVVAFAGLAAERLPAYVTSAPSAFIPTQSIALSAPALPAAVGPVLAETPYEPSVAAAPKTVSRASLEETLKPVAASKMLSTQADPKSDVGARQQASKSFFDGNVEEASTAEAVPQSGAPIAPAKYEIQRLLATKTGEYVYIDALPPAHFFGHLRVFVGKPGMMKEAKIRKVDQLRDIERIFTDDGMISLAPHRHDSLVQWKNEDARLISPESDDYAAILASLGNEMRAAVTKTPEHSKHILVFY